MSWFPSSRYSVVPPSYWRKTALARTLAVLEPAIGALAGLRASGRREEEQAALAGLIHNLATILFTDGGTSLHDVYELP